MTSSKSSAARWVNIVLDVDGVTGVSPRCRRSMNCAPRLSAWSRPRQPRSSRSFRLRLASLPAFFAAYADKGSLIATFILETGFRGATDDPKMEIYFYG
jgi:hypothetical protein